jgi:hypothetical protein
MWSVEMNKTPDGITVTMEEFRKVIHRVNYIIDRYKTHENLTDGGSCRKSKDYDHIDIDFPMEIDEFEIHVAFVKYCCGDTNYVASFDITPEMIENPDEELARYFQKREEDRLRRKREAEEKKKQEAKERKARAEERDREEYQRLKKKFEEMEAR